MKTTALVARILLGLIFGVLGLNGFLMFLPAAPPVGLAGQFLTLMSTSLPAVSRALRVTLRAQDPMI